MLFPLCNTDLPYLAGLSHHSLNLILHLRGIKNA